MTWLRLLDPAASESHFCHWSLESSKHINPMSLLRQLELGYPSLASKGALTGKETNE